MVAATNSESLPFEHCLSKNVTTINKNLLLGVVGFRIYK